MLSFQGSMLFAALAKYHLKIISVLLVCLVGYEFLTSPIVTNSSSSFFAAKYGNQTLPQTPAAHVFWRNFTNALAQGKPTFEEVRRTRPNGDWITFHRHDQAFDRPAYINMTEEERSELRSSRNQAVDDMARLASDLPYFPGTRGIVTTAHPDSFAILATSIYMLRAAGSKLKMEIWLYDQTQYEKEACEVIFPSLNAQCMFMTDFLPDSLESPLKIIKFTFKPLAIAFSSFQEVMFLDDDVFPVMNPDDLFDSEPFISNRALLWPDFWADTASRDLYDFSSLSVPDIRQTASTESGQMLFDKATHAAPLLLATWYNTWGPEYWHRLANQGSPGEGDKDLWRFSIAAYNLPWYQVEEVPQRLGYSCDGKTWPIATAQSHPLDDFKIADAGLVRDRDDMLTLGSSTHPRIIFIHANLPKLDPYLMLDWGRISADWKDVLRCDNGTGPVHRLYGFPDLTIPKYGWDMEKTIWNAFVWMTCEHERGFNVWITPSYWRTEPRTDLCKTFRQIWDEHFPGVEPLKGAPNAKKPIAPPRPWGGVQIS